jgi:hypothetical protein
MLKRMDDSEISFIYPYYYTENRYGSDVNASRLEFVSTATTMNIVATVSGVDIEQGDRLVVFRGGERLTDAEADAEGLYYLNIGSDERADATLTFALERDGELVAVSNSNIVYVADKVMGLPDEPTDINFMEIDQTYENGKWYTTSGILLTKKPTRSGLYIHNGKVTIIK